MGKSDLTHGIRDVAALVGNPAIGVAAAVCVPSLVGISQLLSVKEPLLRQQ